MVDPVEASSILNRLCCTYADFSDGHVFLVLCRAQFDAGRAEGIMREGGLRAVRKDLTLKGIAVPSK